MGYKTGQNPPPPPVAPEPPGGLSMSAPAWACWPKSSLHGLSLRKSPIKNHATLFESSRVINWIKHNLAPRSQQISHLETSSIININRNPPKTIPHPCNSSSCSQAIRPTEAPHNFSFLMVTPLVNMSVAFLDP